MDLMVLVAFLAGLIILIVVGKMLMVPLRYVIRLVVNGLIGGILLWIINLVGAVVGIYVPINIITALTAGFLGIPGVVLLIVLRMLVS